MTVDDQQGGRKHQVGAHPCADQSVSIASGKSIRYTRVQHALDCFHKFDKWSMPVFVEPARDPKPVAPAMLVAAHSDGFPTIENHNGRTMERDGGASIINIDIIPESSGWTPDLVNRLSIRHEKVHAADCAECETKVGMVYRIEVEISFTGDLSEEQQRKLLEFADKCPVHRTLVSRCQIDTRLEMNHA